MSNLSSQNLFSQRSKLIDFLRGLCLVVITIDHLPHDPFETFTWQTFGFVSAAEGFVFLSGLVSGIVYGRVAIREGIVPAWRRIRRRAITLYLYNAVLITLAFLAAKENLAVLGNNFYPGWSLWIKTLLCIESPGYAEILRMYIVFFLILPLVFWALIHNKFVYVAIISAGLWFAASRGYGMVAFPQLGYFDLVSWQLLFVAGISFGFSSIREQKEPEISNRYTAISIPIFTVFLLIRHWHGMTGHYWSPYFVWLASWRETLSVGRLLNFTAFAILIYRLRQSLSRVAKTLPGQALAFLGQHSLQVFVWSVSVSMVMAEADRRWPHTSSLRQSMVTTAIVISCFIPAWAHQKWQDQRREMLRLKSIGQPTLPSFSS